MLNLSLPADAHENYGAPSSVYVSVNISAGNRFAASVVVLGKTATRLPEAAFVTFNPGSNGAWSNEILGVSTRTSSYC